MDLGASRWLAVDMHRIVDPGPHSRSRPHGRPDKLSTSVTIGDYFFCHAGVRPGTPLGQQQQQDLLWIREKFLKATGDFGKIIVHGHSPVVQPDFRKNRINIDTGAYANGRLTCLVLEGSSRRIRST